MRSSCHSLPSTWMIGVLSFFINVDLNLLSMYNWHCEEVLFHSNYKIIHFHGLASSTQPKDLILMELWKILKLNVFLNFNFASYTGESPQILLTAWWSVWFSFLISKIVKKIQCRNTSENLFHWWMLGVWHMCADVSTGCPQCSVITLLLVTITTDQRLLKSTRAK